MARAIAVDLGASSVRYASAELVDGRIEVEVVRQVPNPVVGSEEDPHWSLSFLEGFVREAIQFGDSLGEPATVGIDSWGVDHGFLLDPAPDPFAYRHPSHQAELASLEPYQAQLYGWTGIQKQPFNTIVQLRARTRERRPTAPWLVLPDYLIWRITGDVHQELTQASTTQMLGIDGAWHSGAFALSLWESSPVPLVRAGGDKLATNSADVSLVRVGSHDSASAAFGLGSLGPNDLYLNLGTWSILGCLLPVPLVSDEARSANFSNERAVDGTVRFLKNIPGLWVPNRLHEDLGLACSVGEWLERADPSWAATIDVYHASLYLPHSMAEAVAALSPRIPETAEQWAALALSSLVSAIADAVREVAAVTGRDFERIRVSGGGSRSRALCQAVADATGLQVVAGPVEATLYGNVAVQFVAQGIVGSLAEASALLDGSFVTQSFGCQT